MTPKIYYRELLYALTQAGDWAGCMEGLTAQNHRAWIKLLKSETRKRQKEYLLRAKRKF